MNYEEMLNTQDGAATHRTLLPLGTFYKKLIDRKYRNVVELKPDLANSIVFCEALRRDHEQMQDQQLPLQLDYELHEDSSGIYELELEQGNFQTFAQLLDNNPAVVTGKGFIDTTVQRLMEAAIALHGQGIYHVCFAPHNIFARKADNIPALLCHGSFYQSLSHPSMLYEGFESYIAPEVLRGERIDERCDVYSLGRFIEFLYQQGVMPYEYKAVVRKATQDDPEKRYVSVEAMRSDLARKRASRHSAVTLLVAIVVAVVGVGLYFELMPQTEEIEFVTGVPRETPDDLLDDGFDPETEMGVIELDSAEQALTPEERQEMAEYQAKAEQIFRKQFTREADRILTQVYSNEHMSTSEKKFAASSQSMMEQLIQLQSDLANKAGLTETQSQRIASEIIARITAEKQQGLTSKGYQRRATSDDDEAEQREKEQVLQVPK